MFFYLGFKATGINIICLDQPETLLRPGNKTLGLPILTQHGDFRRSACMTNNNMTILFRHNQDMIGQFINFMFDTFLACEKSITIDSAFRSPSE